MLAVGVGVGVPPMFYFLFSLMRLDSSRPVLQLQQGRGSQAPPACALLCPRALPVRAPMPSRRHVCARFVLWNLPHHQLRHCCLRPYALHRGVQEARLPGGRDDPGAGGNNGMRLADMPGGPPGALACLAFQAAGAHGSGFWGSSGGGNSSSLGERQAAGSCAAASRAERGGGGGAAMSSAQHRAVALERWRNKRKVWAQLLSMHAWVPVCLRVSAYLYERGKQA